ncbi:(R)-mandelonitrile lyase [Wenxinia marina]|uniref:Cupin type-2 domain-containing protein n=1 Tax=Wenxinia marina DSM 24838 TaxID=1123501 RepID=A0A0D0Q2Q8_9RHOB|nr:cupin domain-containing protein [Wenxinia marina]KIQ68829.1 hypothetical protein Wenmar_02557 [Wenxinia marina DSM 24838]GGL64926.1 cupin [Wenxinia marina]
MEHHPRGARPTTDGSADYFTGAVRITPVIEAPDPARVRAAVVEFQPGARTHWHTHPLGQTLHVLSGRGRVQREGGEVVEIATGDTVWFAPDERHWHGAAPDSAMVHLAIQEAENGKAVDWAEAVEEAHYAGTGQAFPG